MKFAMQCCCLNITYSNALRTTIIAHKLVIERGATENKYVFNNDRYDNELLRYMISLFRNKISIYLHCSSIYIVYINPFHRNSKVFSSSLNCFFGWRSSVIIRIFIRAYVHFWVVKNKYGMPSKKKKHCVCVVSKMLKYSTLCVLRKGLFCCAQFLMLDK